MTYRRSLAALAAVLTATACAPLPQRTAQEFLAASPAAVSDYQRGKQDLAAGNYGLALTHFDAAVKHNPDNVAALNGEAIAYAKLDRADAAAAAFERALAVDANSALTLANYAVFLEKQGEHAKAAERLAKRTSSALATAAPPVAAPVAPVAVAALPAAPSPVTATPEPQAALTIANASGQSRLAHRLERYLSGRGFPAEHVANAPTFGRTQSVLYCHAQSQVAAEAIRHTLPGNVKLVVLASKANAIELLAGSDLNNFDAKVALAAPAKTEAVR